MRSRALKSMPLAVLALAVSSGLTGCKPVDNAMVAMFGRSMRDQRSFDPYENPRPEPPHAVAFSASGFPGGRSSVNLGEPEGWRPDLPFLTAAEMAPPGSATVRGLRNPIPSDSTSVARGQVLYDRVCVVCHGPRGIGADAYIASKHPTVAMYDLAGPQVQRYADGYIFEMIRVGRGLMPGHRHEFTYYDGWNIVNYVRELGRRYNQNHIRSDAQVGGQDSGGM